MLPPHRTVTSPHAPLRTGLVSFPTYGSSLSKAFGETRFINFRSLFEDICSVIPLVSLTSAWPSSWKYLLSVLSSQFGLYERTCVSNFTFFKYWPLITLFAIRLLQTERIGQNDSSDPKTFTILIGRQCTFLAKRRLAPAALMSAPNLRTPVYTLFSDFLMMKDLSEVCTLSGQGKYWTPIRTITARHSLSPKSHTHLSIASPYGLVSTLVETIGLTTFRINTLQVT